jgi:hypothetical protein
LNVAVTERLSLRGGYQLLWIDEIALATEQASVNSADFTTAITALDSSASLFYHGANAGMEYAW